MSQSLSHHSRRRRPDDCGRSGFSSPRSFISWATSRSNRSGCFVVFFPGQSSDNNGRRRLDSRRRHRRSSERRMGSRRRDISSSPAGRGYRNQLCRGCRRRRRSNSRSISSSSTDGSPSPSPATRRVRRIHRSPRPVPRRSGSPRRRLVSRSPSTSWISWRRSPAPMRRESRPARFDPSFGRTPSNRYDSPRRETVSPANRRPTPPPTNNNHNSPQRPAPSRVYSSYSEDDGIPLTFKSRRRHSPSVTREAPPSHLAEDSPSHRPEDSPRHRPSATPDYLLNVLSGHVETPRSPKWPTYHAPSRSRSRSWSYF